MRLVAKITSVFLPLFFLVTIKCGKIPANAPHVELADWRMGGDPYVIFYERENYRGVVHFHKLSPTKCSNLDPSFAHWASSVDLQKHCLKLCDKRDCEGKCVMVQADQSPRSGRGVGRLKEYGLNDRVVSVKYCY